MIPRGMVIHVMAAMTFLASSSAMAWTQFNDGGTYDITTGVDSTHKCNK